MSKEELSLEGQLKSQKKILSARATLIRELQVKLQTARLRLRQQELKYQELIEAITDRDPWIGYVRADTCGFCKETYPSHDEDCPYVLAKEIEDA
jgi:hypothetical protein